MLPAWDQGEASAVPGIARWALIGSPASGEPSHWLTDGISVTALLAHWLAIFRQLDARLDLGEDSTVPGIAR
jgi:hypothetical protein